MDATTASGALEHADRDARPDRGPMSMLTRAVLTVICVTGMAGSEVGGQSQGAPPQLPAAAFEVASIKRNQDPDAQLGVRPVTTNRFSGVMTAKMLVQVAYGFPNTLFDGQIVGGPPWTDRDQFEINAVFEGPIAAAPGGPPVRLLAMMRGLLAERFKLQVRTETRQLPVYDLVVDRDNGQLGPRLTRSDGSCLPITAATEPVTDFSRYCGFRRFSPGVMSAKGGTLESLAGALAFLPDVQRVVRDRTGLAGQFDFDLEYTQVAAANDPQAGPTIFTALREQLGLTLRPATGPVEVLVIDRLEPPTPD